MREEWDGGSLRSEWAPQGRSGSQLRWPTRVSWYARTRRPDWAAPWLRWFVHGGSWFWGSGQGYPSSDTLDFVVGLP